MRTKSIWFDARTDSDVTAAIGDWFRTSIAAALKKGISVTEPHCVDLQICYLCFLLFYIMEHIKVLCDESSDNT